MKDLLKHSWLAVILVVLLVLWFAIYGLAKNNPLSNVASLPTVEGEAIIADNQTSLDVDNTSALAEHLTAQGYKLYGAFWCSHCKAQKDLFGDAFDKVNYIECSTPDGKNQTEVCEKADIQSYPTWELPDGTRKSGTMTLQELANISNFPLN